MAIQLLPAATTRILGSSQVLTTPSSLVKELVDNALDAKASLIDIIISSNTLDKIEVRDNGHGIASSDLNVIGRHGYTSKLRSFEDLRTVGGLTLGFRGQALASAVELGEVSITTRTEGEPVATTIKLRSPGVIDSQTTTSHPVGTTVCVTNYLSKLPVRKQTALGKSKRTLSSIKDMLKSYALARLTVRLSLRVLRVAKSNWSFAPRPKDSIRDVVSQVIGREIVAQCMENIGTWEPDCLDSMNAEHNGHQFMIPEHPTRSSRDPRKFIFQAFLPRPNADFSHVNGGHHVSIDSRPVSCIRGPLKKFVAMYKTFINASAAKETSNMLKDPFIRVNIICPIGSYDPNIEPAKDDIVFEDESMFLDIVKGWLSDIYGVPIRAPLVADLSPQSFRDEYGSRLVHKIASPDRSVETTRPEVPESLLHEGDSTPWSRARSSSFVASQKMCRDPFSVTDILDGTNTPDDLNRRKARQNECHNERDHMPLELPETVIPSHGLNKCRDSGGLSSSQTQRSSHNTVVDTPISTSVLDGVLQSPGNGPYIIMKPPRSIIPERQMVRLLKGLETRRRDHFPNSHRAKGQQSAQQTRSFSHLAPYHSSTWASVHTRQPGSMDETISGWLDHVGDIDFQERNANLNPWSIAKLNAPAHQLKSSLDKDIVVRPEFLFTRARTRPSPLESFSPHAKLHELVQIVVTDGLIDWISRYSVWGCQPFGLRVAVEDIPSIKRGVYEALGREDIEINLSGLVEI